MLTSLPEQISGNKKFLHNNQKLVLTLEINKELTEQQVWSLKGQLGFVARCSSWKSISRCKGQHLPLL